MEEIKTVQFIKNLLSQNGVKNLKDIHNINNVTFISKDRYFFDIVIDFQIHEEYNFKNDFNKMSRINKEVFFVNEDTLESFEMGLADNYHLNGGKISFVISKVHLNKYFFGN